MEIGLISAVRAVPLVNSSHPAPGAVSRVESKSRPEDEDNPSDRQKASRGLEDEVAYEQEAGDEFLDDQEADDASSPIPADAATKISFFA